MSRISVKAHLLIGEFIGTSEFRKVYKNDRQVQGFEALVGYNKTYLIGKFRNYKASDASKSQLLPDGGQANWSQTFSFLGVRTYESNSLFNIYGELGYIQTGVKERVVANNPLYESLNSDFQKTYNGLAFGTGAELKVWIISLEGGVEYAYIPPKFIKGANTAGGLLFTFGLGVAL